MKQKQIFIIIFSFSLVGMILHHSCIKEQGPLPVAVSKSFCDSLSVKWSVDLQPLIQTQCFNPGCHDPAATNYSGIDISGYTQMKSLADFGKIKTRVLDGNGGWMPPAGPLPLADREKINCWLQDGAPQN